MAFADLHGQQPDQLVALGYDLCYPLPSIPLGRLRRDCAEWRTDRGFQAVGTMPLLFPSHSDVWPQHVQSLRELFRVPQIYALVPLQELWAKPFADWTPEDWANPQHLSILWNIQTGTVHFKGGIQFAEETSQNGKTFSDLIAEIER